ncbi:ATP-binding protein [Streptosporangium canum]|uniref:ATP-binding protein n=1 Tax=Streptosporangium canum TaxID=324952 RepID=UPI0033B07899
MAEAAREGVWTAQESPEAAQAPPEGETAEDGVRTLSLPIAGELAGIRRLARRFLEPEALDAMREKNFILAVSEAANNVLDHAGTGGTIILRRGTGRVVAEISDRAGLLTDTEAGTVPPPVGSRRGYGLWLMRQMCDGVEILHDPAGSTIRLTILRA